ncbi:hypothetical protein PoB_006922600 [Plakobranchus ocellatus]|uniref:Uncharacterized protein n=1 Tax=Plakobranchus ocellatus TaxID=259542 RepID=A0AAV4DFW8_9GAST|nr:hypothetical protein PoB_006922600 [Plakobranchus ocellatus]
MDKNECKNLNGTCVSKDSKFSVMHEGKRHDNCSCSIQERHYESFSQKARELLFSVQYSCENKTFSNRL